MVGLKIKIFFRRERSNKDESIQDLKYKEDMSREKQRDDSWR